MLLPLFLLLFGSFILIFPLKLCLSKLMEGVNFVSFSPFFKEFGINQRLTYPYSHQQNESIERWHRHIDDIGLSLFSHALFLTNFELRLLKLLPILLIVYLLLFYPINIHLRYYWHILMIIHFSRFLVVYIGPI